MRLIGCLLIAAALSGCVIIDDEPDQERGWVHCGDDNLWTTCQPGTYCSGPRIAACNEGCVSDANCMEHERCFKEEEGDRVGACIQTRRVY